MKIYMYNPKTRLLHIVGYCKNSPSHEVADYKYFYTENDAIAYAGRQVSMCIDCAKARDKLLCADISSRQKRKQ